MTRNGRPSIAPAVALFVLRLCPWRYARMPLIALTRPHFGVYIADLPGQCGGRLSRIKRVIKGAREIKTFTNHFPTLNCSHPHLKFSDPTRIATSTRKAMTASNLARRSEVMREPVKRVCVPGMAR